MKANTYPPIYLSDEPYKEPTFEDGASIKDGLSGRKTLNPWDVNSSRLRETVNTHKQDQKED